MATTASEAPPLGQNARLDAADNRVGEIMGQRNVVDAQLVDVIREIETDDLWGLTGCRSLEQWIAWKTGSSPHHARELAAVARRTETFPVCMALFRSGVLSLDQMAVIAERALEGSDEHYAQLAPFATVAQLRKAMKLAPKPKTDPRPEPETSLRKISDDDVAHYRLTLTLEQAARFDAALASHLDALVAEWKRDHVSKEEASENAPPFPTEVDAFMRLIEHGWDADVKARPHGHRTTVILHVGVESQIGTLHLGPALSEAERRYLSCDSLVETWFEKDGKPIGVARETRQIPRRLRRALEFRHPTCAVPGCGATRGLHAHHIWHWEEGGPTELWNLVLVCPFHHRMHHRGLINIRGPGHAVTVTDAVGRVMTGGSVARPPTAPPPAAPPYAGPTGERCDWYWYQPFEPKAPSDN